MEPAWIVNARKYLGVKEGQGKLDNPTVVAMYAKAGHPEVKHDEIPWCAAFIGAVLKDSGLKGTGTLWALDYAKWGVRLHEPVVGAVATKKRAGGGHVFFVVGYTDKYVWGLGGNQADAVSIVRFDRAVVNSYSWPRGVPLPTNVPKTWPLTVVEKAGKES